MVAYLIPSAQYYLIKTLLSFLVLFCDYPSAVATFLVLDVLFWSKNFMFMSRLKVYWLMRELAVESDTHGWEEFIILLTG